MKNLIPYLIFPGNCKEAMNFYKECLNGEISYMRTVEDSPLKVKDENKHRIFDSELKADNITIRASDDMPGYETVIGRNFSLFTTFENEEEQKDVYDKLLDGGQAIMPLPETKGESKFAMLKDKFGIQWMMVYNHK